jgi:O-methyltransferase
MMSLSEKHIDILKKSILGNLYIENEYYITNAIGFLSKSETLTLQHFRNVDRKNHLFLAIEEAKENGTLLLFNRLNADGTRSPAHGLRNFTQLSHTMVGRKRMDNIQFCIEQILSANIVGDLVETGVWRGGATIFMRGVLFAHGVTDRTVWVADSFQGLPAPTYPEDAGYDFSEQFCPILSVSRAEVEGLFSRYGLLDEQVRFLEGWFKDTLPEAPIDSIALLRLDGDLYESTMDALKALYDRVSVGGYIIVDDYNSLSSCKQAITEFRESHGVSGEIVRIDDSSVFWKKQ